MTEGASSFAAQLRRYRARHGLTQDGLAEAAGLSTRAISDLERGVKVRPHRDTVDRLAAALGLVPAEVDAFVAASRPRRPRLAGVDDSRARGNLPLPPNAILGRETELQAIEALLRSPDVRLVTLTGTGGTGKTRLAIEVAAGLQAGYQDGVFLVSLGALTDPRLVGSTIAHTLQLRDATDEQLLDTLASRQMLLVLDNFEHLVDAAVLVAEILSRAPGVSVLATSRAPLGIAAEHEYAVLPLPLPSGERSGSATAPAAVTLFVQRARAVRPDLVIAREDEAAIVDICSRLDGLPLAIELAAARCRLLTPRAISGRLERRLHLLTTGNRDSPPRHQTLRAALAWSHDLLSLEAQASFRHLAVFAGGFSLEAAAALAGGSGTQPGEPDILDRLAMLVGQSLVGRDTLPDGEPRFSMLETVREYGLEMLDAAGEEQEVRAAHAQYFARFTLAAEPKLVGPDQLEWFQRLELEHANLRLALGWSLVHDHPQAMAMAGALIRFWDHHGHRHEGLRWIAAALDTAGGQTSPLRGKLLWGRGTLALVMGDYDHARQWLEDGVVAARAAGDLYHAAFSLNTRGTIASDDGDLARARTLHEDGLALLLDLGDQDGIAALQGNLGYDLMLEGQLKDSIDRCRASLAIYRELGSAHGCASMLSVLGQATLLDGQLDVCGQYLREGIHFANVLGNQIYLVYFLHSMAALAAAESQWERSARLFGATDALKERIDYHLTAFPQSIGDRARDRLRANADAAFIESHMNQGMQTSLNDMLSYALSASPTAARVSLAIQPPSLQQVS